MRGIHPDIRAHAFLAVNKVLLEHIVASQHHSVDDRLMITRDPLEDKEEK
jgi:hypothetical protein